MFEAMGPIMEDKINVHCPVNALYLGGFTPVVWQFVWRINLSFGKYDFLMEQVFNSIKTLIDKRVAWGEKVFVVHVLFGVSQHKP